MRAEQVLKCYVLRVVKQSSKEQFTLQNVQTGQTTDFSSWDSLLGHLKDAETKQQLGSQNNQ